MENPCIVGKRGSACFRFPLQRLQWQDSERGHTYKILLHVYNTAGHYLSVTSQEFKIPSRFPPGHGVVVDVDPDNPDDTTDVDFVSLSNSICGSWHGFWHLMDVTYEVAVGSLRGKDDAINFRVVNSSHSSCLSIAGLIPFTRYFFTVRATCSGGSTVVSSDGLVLIDKDVVRQSLHIYDGKKCSSIKSVAVQSGSNFTVPDTIVPEDIYTIRSNCSDHANLKSFEVIWLRKDVFVPSNSNPIFYFNENLYNESCVCYEDIEFIHSTTEMSAYWSLSSNVLNHVTSFKVGLLDSTSNGLVAPEMDVGKITDFTFTRLDMAIGHMYNVLVRPCFTYICTTTLQSDGVVLEAEPIGKPMNITLSAPSIDAIVEYNFKAFSCSSSGSAKGYHIALFDNEIDRKQISSWQVLDFRSDSMVKVCYIMHSNLFV